EEDTSEEEGKTEAMESQTAEEDTSGGDQPGEAEAVDESSDFGLLSADEIAGLEALYGQNPSGLLESLGLTEADAASNDTSVTLTDPRIIGDRAFTVRYDFYTDDPGGMVEVMYSLGLSDDAENTVALVRTIYEAAVSAYGEPSAYEGQEGRISQSLEEIEASGISGIYQEDWAVGEQTRLNMTVMLYEDNNMDNNMVVISLTYQLEE
ncbi:MAG: hypothetical protein LUC30_08005, partial [Clostridiales bacterium]|nr:hypothetical protein [Clostridiales bacterium]